MSEAVVRPEAGPREAPPVGNLPLWTGVLAGPIAFLVLLAVNYVYVDWACATSHQWPMHVADAVALAVTAFALLLSWRSWLASGREWPRDVEPGSVPRARFLAVLGMLVSGGFVLVMVAQWIPVMILGPCQRS